MDLPPITDAPSAQALARAVIGRLHAAGLAPPRAPPREPTTCCGRGCNGCVWEGYFEAVAWWRDEALTLLDAGTD